MGVRVLRQARKNFLKRHGEILKKQMPGDPKMAMYMAKKSAEKINKLIKMMNSQVHNTHDFSKIAAADSCHIDRTPHPPLCNSST